LVLVGGFFVVSGYFPSFLGSVAILVLGIALVVWGLSARRNAKRLR